MSVGSTPSLDAAVEWLAAQPGSIALHESLYALYVDAQGMAYA